jgi:2-polyprenyl-3-methyl-5-hydroxy-6-metoxy-1,4-benzoquinol methylase
MRPFLDVSLLGTRPASVHRCDACGFRQIRPRLTAQEIKALYPSDYFDSASPVGYADYAREFQRRQREAYFLTRWLRRLGPNGRLLEVGCALGFLLAGLKRSQWRLEGVDASAFAAFYARSRYGLDVTCATLEEAAFPDDTFDVVIQKDLLEHVANPRRHLDETRRLLRPGGWLRLVTPNGEANLRPLLSVSPASPASGAARPVLDQGHLSFFRRRQLMRLFEECGFRCRSMRMIGIKRGLSALGRLPGQARFVRLAPSVGSAEPPEGPVVADVDTDERFQRLAERIDRDIASRHSGLRGWTPYFFYHRAMKRLDTLPAWCEVGYDFDCLLQKR